MKYTIKFFILIIFILSLISSGLYAQTLADTTPDENFFPYLQDDVDMKIVQPEKSFSTKGIQYGGWITPVLILQKSDERTLFVSMTSARLYLKTYLWSNSFLYIRGKDVFLKTITDDGYTIDQTKNLVDLDLGFMGISNSSGSARLFLGRKFFRIGSGVVLNGRGDGAEFRFFSSAINFKILGLYTGLLRKDNNPYKLSNMDITEGAKRVFAAGSISKTFYNQTLYMFGLGQFDFGEEDSSNKTKYQSQYYGIGLKGYVFSNMIYDGEFIYQRGKSYVTGTSDQENITAFAGIFNMKYFFNVKTNPVLIIQYAYGSGDKDRFDSRAPNGNSSGTDTGFISFGPYSGGYALKPTLSNIHVIRGGFSIVPFSNRLVLISKYSYYMKDAIGGGIKYGEGKESERFIGQGVDVSIRWKIFSDLSFFVNYAIFIPGNVYLSSEEEGKGNLHFVLSGLNISF